MENINFEVSELEKAADLEHMEYLITGGKTAAEVIKMYPQYDKAIIYKMVENVARFCWYSDNEWEGLDYDC